MAGRKLQAEIDRVLKKIQDGIQEFDETWNKVKEATTPNLKDKYEADLKKEIKKLQRFRDQVKTWAQSNEVKNKKPLVDARKAIEAEMERFKVLERETKTKAYSKEGLSQSMMKKKDPTKDPNYPYFQWIDDTNEKFLEKKGEHEATLDKYRSSSKSAKKHEYEIEQLVSKIERINWHLEKLSETQDSLSDGDIAPKRMEEIKEDVDLFFESSDNPDYFFDTAMYDVDDEDNPNSETYINREDEDADDAQDVLNDEPVIQVAAAVIQKKKKDTIVPAEGTTTTKSKSTGKSKSEKQDPSTKEKKEKKSSKKKSADATEEKASVTKNSPKNIERVSADDEEELPPSSGPLEAFPTLRSSLRQSAASPTAEQARPLAPKPVTVPPRVAPQQTLANMLAAKHSNNKGSQQSPGPNAQTSSSQAQSAQAPSIQSPTAETTGEESRDEETLSAEALSVETASTEVPGTEAAQTSNKRVPPVARASSLAQASQAASVALARRPGLDDPALAYTLRMILPSRQHLPTPADTTHQTQYVPRNPFRTPPSFPSTVAPVFDDPMIFSRFSSDTLFFIFYFQQGTQHQYLAARELKKQSWRYHKDYLTWFQRHDDPKLTTDEYEQGAYLYFDYKQTWQHAIKPDFTFHYSHLEDELINNLEP